MQNRVFNSTDVLINREPVFDRFRAERGVVVVVIAVAVKVPRRVNERVHRIGFAPGRLAALWTVDVDEGRGARERAFPLSGQLRVFGQNHGQVLIRHRDHAAGGAMNHRNRRSPIALARDSPILNAERNGGFAEPVRLGVSRHAGPSLRGSQARPLPGILGDPVFRERKREFALRRTNDRHDRNFVLRTKLEVAFVVGGNSHNRACSVAGEHEVAHPNRHRLPAERVDRAQAGIDADLLHFTQALRCAGVDHRLHRGGLIAGNVLFDEVVFGRENNASSPENRVDPRRKHPDFLAGTGHREINLGPFTPADPVPLHRQHAVRPTTL